MNIVISGIELLDILIVGVASVAIIVGIFAAAFGSIFLTIEGLERHPNITLIVIVIVAVFVFGLGIQTLDWSKTS